MKGDEMTEYTQGCCEDGAAILKDGHMLTIEDILAELRCIPVIEDLNEELKAHCERFRSVYDLWGDQGVTDLRTHEAFEAAVKSTPEQSLNKIKAQAIENAIKLISDDPGDSWTFEQILNDYANQLRNEQPQLYTFGESSTEVVGDAFERKE